MSLIQTTWAVCDDVERERKRQDSLVESGKIPWNCSDPDTDLHAKLTVLAEEFGEVARAILEGGNVYEECVHCAAVAVAIAESVRE